MISPANVAKEFVLSKCDYFVDVQLWPIETRINPVRWLENFEASEMDHAIHLLSAFTYYSGHMVRELFKAAFHSLSRIVVPRGIPYIKSEATWTQFCQNALVTYVTGERPHHADSGQFFARMARQELRIPEGNIQSPDEVLESLMRDGPRPVVFVDDFIGSGNQFVTTWNREVQLPRGERVSFRRVAGLTGTEFYYCPLISTEYGRDNILKASPQVVICAAHVLPDRYSALAEDSIVWPDHLRPTAKDFLRTASARAGISEPDCGGFHGLALTLAFEHCVPDATLPIFYCDNNGWFPLVRRT